jgi:hypothetical protein
MPWVLTTPLSRVILKMHFIQPLLTALISNTPIQIIRIKDEEIADLLGPHEPLTDLTKYP